MTVIDGAFYLKTTRVTINRPEMHFSRHVWLQWDYGRL